MNGEFERDREAMQFIVAWQKENGADIDIVRAQKVIRDAWTGYRDKNCRVGGSVQRGIRSSGGLFAAPSPASVTWVCKEHEFTVVEDSDPVPVGFVRAKIHELVPAFLK